MPDLDEELRAGFAPKHIQDANGRCARWCYACERRGLQERVKLTESFETLQFRLREQTAALAALAAQLREQQAEQMRQAARWDTQGDSAGNAHTCLARARVSREAAEAIEALLQDHP